MRAHVYNGKTLKKRNYLDENEGEEKASGGGWEELLQFPWQPSFLPHPSVPHPSLVLLILNKHFLSNVLCAPRGGTRILKYSVPGIPSSRTGQTFVYFQYLLICRGKPETETHGDQDSNSDHLRAPPAPPGPASVAGSRHRPGALGHPRSQKEKPRALQMVLGVGTARHGLIKPLGWLFSPPHVKVLIY